VHEAAPNAEEKRPAGQGVGADDATGQKEPAQRETRSRRQSTMAHHSSKTKEQRIGEMGLTGRTISAEGVRRRQRRVRKAAQRAEARTRRSEAAGAEGVGAETGSRRQAAAAVGEARGKGADGRGRNDGAQQSRTCTEHRTTTPQRDSVSELRRA
jgi:hypothetical protein